MKYTDDNVSAVAQIIVDSLDLKDLMSYVYDDLYVTMEQDEDMFHYNVETFVNTEE